MAISGRVGDTAFMLMTASGSLSLLLLRKFYLFFLICNFPVNQWPGMKISSICAVDAIFWIRVCPIMFGNDHFFDLFGFYNFFCCYCSMHRLSLCVQNR